MEIYVFPYEKVRKGSKVVIYGAGYAGRRYVEQILENGYCELVCVVDRQAHELQSASVKLENPAVLGNCIFDYLVIAIQKAETAETIKKDLIEKYAVPAEKILWKGSQEYRDVPSKCIWAKLPEPPQSDKDVLISAFFGDGFGDAIISKKIIMALREVAGPCCQIDLYVMDATYDFVRGLFKKDAYVRNIYRESVYRFSRYCQSYDLSILPLYIMSIEHYEPETVQRKNPGFADCISKLKACLDKAGLDNRHGVDNGVVFARAKKIGCNAYTYHAYGGILPIHDTQVDIPLLEEREKDYKELFQKVGSTPFITVNYGWGKNSHENDYIPAKIWPYSYYAKLVKLIKSKYKGLNIVQIGRKNTPQIPGIDIFLCDWDIEVIKYVLKNSLLHIDSEGGMVHLATQLGAKCLVPFGPTPIHFFGYESNINVVSDGCNDCCYMDEDFTRCIRDMAEPECMYSIKPETMFGKFEAYIKEIGLHRTLKGESI